MASWKNIGTADRRVAFKNCRTVARSVNDARFSMRLPHETLAFAQGYAAQYDMTLTDLILRYFERLKCELSTSSVKKARRRPVRNIDKYIGIVKGAEHLTDEELDEARFKYLSEKYA